MKGTLATRITALLLLWAGALGAMVYVIMSSSYRPAAGPPAVMEQAGSEAVPERAAPKPPSVASAPAPAAVTAAAEALKTLRNTVGPQTERIDRAPAFDIARVEPNGDSVIAGRAAPGATVELLRGGKVHDRTVANQSGEFVFVPKPLPAGSYDLTLRATQPDGKESMSKDSVAVDLSADNKTRPVVALVAPDKPAIVLSKPAVDPPALLTIDAVESDTGGRLYVSGRSAPGTSVRLYLNDSYIASATASPEGRVAFAIRGGVKPGDYRIRLDQVEASGSVRSRAEVPFNAPVRVAAPASPAAPASDPAAAPSVPPASPSAMASTPAAAASTQQPASSESAPRRAAAPSGKTEISAPQSTFAPRDSASIPAVQPPLPAASQPAPQALTLAGVPGDRKSVVVVPSIDTTVVTRGDSLWRISETTYGRGIRYSVIYAANRKQIRDPDLIYPGQIFVLPNVLPKE